MNIYRRLGDEVATIEARAVAEQLVAWHDAMVKHLRVLTSREDARCGEDCPHDDAASLWVTAEAIFGARARQLVFLRSHARSRRQVTAPLERERAAEIRM